MQIKRRQCYHRQILLYFILDDNTFIFFVDIICKKLGIFIYVTVEKLSFDQKRLIVDKVKT
jgi:hypothetical protein